MVTPFFYLGNAVLSEEGEKDLLSQGRSSKSCSLYLLKDLRVDFTFSIICCCQVFRFILIEN